MARIVIEALSVEELRNIITGILTMKLDTNLFTTPSTPVENESDVVEILPPTKMKDITQEQIDIVKKAVAETKQKAKEVPVKEVVETPVIDTPKAVETIVEPIKEVKTQKTIDDLQELMKQIGMKKKISQAVEVLKELSCPNYRVVPEDKINYVYDKWEQLIAGE